MEVAPDGCVLENTWATTGPKAQADPTLRVDSAQARVPKSRLEIDLISNTPKKILESPPPSLFHSPVYKIDLQEFGFASISST